MDELKLKQYKSCADCRSYEFAGRNSDGYCAIGFPLTKLDTPVVRGGRYKHDTLFFEHKPKYGCLQKNRYGAKLDFERARKIALKLQ